MSIKTKNAGAYADIVGVFHKRAGTYEAVQGVFAKVGGVYGRVDAAPAAVPPLDSLSAGAAFSTRLLRTAYTGPLLRVRRLSDNTEQDIPASDGWLDEANLLSFVGASSAFVTTWYDQSGNGRNVTQSNTSNQPRIVNSGVVDKQNGKPSLVFNGTTNVLFSTAPFMYAAGSASVAAVLRGVAQNDRRIVFEGSNVSFSPFYAFQSINNGTGQHASVLVRNDANTVLLASTNNLLANQFDDQFRTLVWSDTGSAFRVYGTIEDGAEVSYTRSGALTLNRFSVGAMVRSTVESFFNGALSEVICFAPGLSGGGIASIESNQISAYGVSVNPS